MMSSWKKKNSVAPNAIEIPALQKQRGHFRFNTISTLVLILTLVLGFVLQVFLGGLPEAEPLAIMAALALGAAVVLYLLPYWPMAVALAAAAWAVPPVWLEVDFSFLSAALTLGLILAPGFEVVNHWDKIVVLRLGRFHRVKGPGILLLFPMVDSVAGYVDTRIRVTDFSAEMSLTKDTVPVNVDALAFWMVWDPGKAVMEVQDYSKAVALSAQTALRSSIGAHDLTTLLSDRDRLGREIQEQVDAKTNPWGITIISVEFKEILVPKDLEDSLSREAQAERERRARLILGDAEAQVAKAYRQAAQVYGQDATALQLRGMSMVYEGIRDKGGLVLAPSSALEGMNLGTALGAAAHMRSVQNAPSNPTTPGEEMEETEQKRSDQGSALENKQTKHIQQTEEESHSTSMKDGGNT